jgi:hypothetical protein
MLRVLIYALPIILAVYALVDLVQTDADDVQGLPKLAWAALIVLIWIIGPVAWLLAGRRGRRFRLPGLSPRPAGPGSPGRTLAPDDDPDFLRGLRGMRPPPPPATPDDEDGPPEPPVPTR